MDRATIEVYERSATAYADARPGAPAARREAFRDAVVPGVVRTDLGCGPGLDLSHLGDPVVGLDAAAAMLVEARRRAPGASLVRADVARLPFRSGVLGGAWAAKSLQHLPLGGWPLALAGIHRALVLGAPLHLKVFAGDGAMTSDDDLPGRLFALTSAPELGDLLVGAGFEDVHVRVDPDHESGLLATAIRSRTLADTVGDGMRLLLCGLNPSVCAADAGVAFFRPGNRFWPALIEAGLATRARDPDDLLRSHGIGMTDLVKRATPRADVLTRDEYRAGVVRLERLCARHRPEAVCLVGLAGWRAAVDRKAVAGWQERTLGPTPVYVMPSTSGLNAHSRLGDLVEHLREAAGGPPG